MHYFISQIQDKDCGYACLKMLLAIVYQDKNFLYLPQDLYKKEGYSFRELAKIANRYNVRLSGYRILDKENIISVEKPPFLVPIREINGSFHLVLVKKVVGNRLTIYDPKRGALKIKLKDLCSQWDGSYLAITEIGIKDFNIKNPYPVDKKSIFSLFSIEIITNAFLAVGLYFVQDSTLLYLSITFLVVFVLLQIFFKRYLLSLMERFDDKYYEALVTNSDNIYENLKRITKFKSLLLGTPIKLVSNVCSFAILTIILSINNPLSLIFAFLTLVLAFADHFIFKTSTYKESLVIANEEKQLLSLSSMSKEETYSLLKNISKKSYKVIALVTIRKYVLSFIGLVFATLMMFIEGVYT